eukprot:5461309-Karenia_brevis.AAC.1
MEGKQTVPRSGMTAVMRALLAVEQYGQQQDCGAGLLQGQSPYSQIYAGHRLGGDLGQGRGHNCQGYHSAN